VNRTLATSQTTELLFRKQVAALFTLLAAVWAG